jgi:hypothetical protein
MCLLRYDQIQPIDDETYTDKSLGHPTRPPRREHQRAFRLQLVPVFIEYPFLGTPCHLSRYATLASPLLKPVREIGQTWIRVGSCLLLESYYALCRL